MIGFNTNFSTEIPFVTRLVNKIPTIKTNVPSSLSFRGEVAHLIAGNQEILRLNGETNVYIDDFEGAQTNIDIKGFNSWKLSSVPFKNFKGSEINDDLKSGFGRAKNCRKSIDPIFYAGGRPSGINNDDVSLNTTRRIFIKEIFPEQDLVQEQQQFKILLIWLIILKKKVLTTIQQMKSLKIRLMKIGGNYASN